MTTKFCDTRSELREDFNEPVRSNPLWIGQALARLSVKAPTIMNLGTAITDRDPQRFRHFQHNGTNRLSKMHVLVGIDVAWVFARQVPENSELA